MDGMWECPKCQGLTKVTVMSAPVRCQQCGADMRRVGPTDTERLAALVADLEKLRVNCIDAPHCQGDDLKAELSRAVCKIFGQELDALIAKHCPDGEGGE